MTTRFVAFAGVLDTIDSESKKAEFLLLTEGANINKQGLTSTEITKVLPSLKGKPLRVGSNNEPGHFQPFKKTVGVFNDSKQENGYATGTATITDPKTIEMLQSGELGPISWNINFDSSTCSKCNADLPALGWSEHDCIKNGSAYAQLHNACFESFDFVPEPAYPEAGFKKFAAAGILNFSDKTQKLHAYACFFESSQLNQTQQKNDKVKSEKTMSEINELTTRISQLETKLEANTTTIAGFNSLTADVTEIKAAMKTITDNIAVQSQKAHTALVDEAYKQRAAAGIAAEEAVEKTKLGKKTDAELQENIDDAKQIIAKTNPESENNEQTTPPLPSNQNFASAGACTKKVDLKKIIEENQKAMGFK